MMNEMLQVRQGSFQGRIRFAPDQIHVTRRKPGRFPSPARPCLPARFVLRWVPHDSPGDFVNLEQVRTYLPFIALMLVIVGYDVWFRIPHRRATNKTNKAIQNLCRWKNLIGSLRVSEIEQPVLAMPGWKTRLGSWERDVRERGYRLLLYTQNDALADAGFPNFSAVYVSPDAMTVAEIHFRTEPPASGNVEDGVGADLARTSCTSTFPGPHWVVTDGGIRAPVKDSPSWITRNNLRPDGASVRQMLVSHELYIRPPLWVGEPSLPYTSPAAYLRSEIDSLERYKKRRRADQRDYLAVAERWMSKREVEKMRTVMEL